MKKIAVTSQMGSGKTFITKEFNKLGVPILIMDDLAKQVQITNQDLIDELCKRFPEGYPNGVLDKMKLREILFNDETGKNKKDISIIIRPYLFQELYKFFEANIDRPYVLVESALLYEYNLEGMFDAVIFVHSDPKLRKEKAIKRDNITSEEYDNRMRNQLSDEFKLKNSDYTIINDFTSNTIDEVYKLHKLLS